MNPRLNVLGVCLTMLHQGLAESTEAASALHQLLPAEMLFQTFIPRDDIFIRASAKGLPVGALENGKGAEIVFDSLRAEVQAKLARSRATANYQPH